MGLECALSKPVYANDSQLFHFTSHVEVEPKPPSQQYCSIYPSGVLVGTREKHHSEGYR
jgi:hypothetical protein